MIKVPVAQLKEGQVLAQDVNRDDGVVLMAKGREMTPEAISLLERLQVDAVVIEGEAFASEEERLAFVAQAEAQLDRRFARIGDDPVLRAIRELFRAKVQGGHALGGLKATTPDADDPSRLLKTPGGKAKGSH